MMTPSSFARGLRLGLFACVSSLSACGGDSGPDPETCTVYAWEPGTGDLSSFPTTDFLREDPSTRTGFQAGMDESVDLSAYGPLAPLFREQAVDLDGVGLQGEMWLGFSRPLDPDLLPTADGEAHAEDGAGIVVLPESGDPYLVPVQIRAHETYLYVRPLRPLPPGTRVAHFATKALTPAAGGCFEPSGTMRGLVRRPDEDRAVAIDALVGLGVIEQGRDLVALHVVTTETAVDESRAIAAHIQTLDSAITDISCTDEATYRRCDGSLLVEDYRDQETNAVAIDVDAVEAVQTWTLPVAIWLPPADQTGPYPTFVYGHGLTDDRTQANFIGPDFAAQGWATVAIDAVLHGDHPGTPEGEVTGAAATFRFFALDLETISFEARQLRDHFRQSTYDKLQLVHALERVGDLDGDGERDVALDQLGYFGISLGGIMSTELAALSDRFSIVVNLLGGGTYSRIVYDPTSRFSGILNLVLRRQGPDLIAQSFSALQAVLDPGDGTIYAQHVLANRFTPGSTIPDYLFAIAVDDDTVSNASSFSLARGLGVGISGEVLRADIGLPDEPAAEPYSGNWADGAATVAFLEFDVVDDEMEGIVPAAHPNLPQSGVARAAWEPFVSSHIADGLATLVDPYVEEGLAHGLP